MCSAFAGLASLVDCGGKEVEHEYASGAATGTGFGGDLLGGGFGGNGRGASSSNGASAGDSNTAATSGDNTGGSAFAGDSGGPGGGTGKSGSSGSGGTDMSAGAGGASSAGIAGAAGADESGGASAVGGSGNSSGAGGEPAATECASQTECRRPANVCLSVSCVEGACVTDYVPAGPQYLLDFPPDCHATTACDGAGNATLVVDQSNTPTADNPCLVGTCNKAGATGTMPRPNGTPCETELFWGKCNGADKCVPCLADQDCPLGQTCNPLQQCIGEPCSDTNCGGACPACAGKHCATDNDCASRVCDPQSKKCVTDPQCTDQKQDGNETDTDCGGGTCSLCDVGKACLVDVDCKSVACDAISHSCVDNACVDHRVDADESDLDCGGTNMACPRCGIAKKCFSNWDCVSGHFCNGSKVCQ